MYDKLIKLYPELAVFDFTSGVITLQNDSDGKGDYIARWSHPTLKEPTQEQLDAI
jgi:hypothetical protein